MKMMNEFDKLKQVLSNINYMNNKDKEVKNPFGKNISDDDFKKLFGIKG